MRTIKTILVDDEITAINALQEELKIYCPHIDIVAVCDGFINAVHTINELQPELVFLDIHLGDGTGFQVIEHVQFKGFKTIFTTAYDSYAIKAFKVNALDYLLKPVSGLELLAAVNKVTELPIVDSSQKKSAIALQGNRFAVQLSKGINFFSLHEISRFEAEGNYVWIYCTNGEKHLSSKSLKDFEDALASYGFIRVHHAHFVNTFYIKRISTKDGMFIEMNDLTSIPVSQRKRAQLLAAIEQVKV